MIADAARHGFAAGRHYQAVWNKPFEADSVRGRKARLGSEAGRASRKGKLSEKTASVLAAMQGYVDGGHSVNRAAELAFKKGLGTSPGANEKLWHRHRR